MVIVRMGGIIIGLTDRLLRLGSGFRQIRCRLPIQAFGIRSMMTTNTGGMAMIKWHLAFTCQ
jgi:hypothetical protein